MGHVGFFGWDTQTFVANEEKDDGPKLLVGSGCHFVEPAGGF